LIELSFCLGSWDLRGVLFLTARVKLHGLPGCYTSLDTLGKVLDGEISVKDDGFLNILVPEKGIVPKVERL
jgi:hypothetical protein